MDSPYSRNRKICRLCDLSDLPGSVSDAKYLVFHKGGVTEFLVNQQIGGGTWVYLGTLNSTKEPTITVWWY